MHNRKAVLVGLLFLLLGVCYANKSTADEKATAESWRRLAEQGDAWAQYTVGFYYANGRGVTKDKAEAVKWWRKAAEQGHVEAQYILGMCYGKSEGVAKDEAEAVKWYRKAAEQGHADAQNALGFCYSIGLGVAQDYAEAKKWYCKAAERGSELAKKSLAWLALYSSSFNPGNTTATATAPRKIELSEHQKARFEYARLMRELNFHTEKLNESLKVYNGCKILLGLVALAVNPPQEDVEDAYRKMQSLEPLINYQQKIVNDLKAKIEELRLKYNF